MRPRTNSFPSGAASEDGGEEEGATGGEEEVDDEGLLLLLADLEVCFGRNSNDVSPFTDAAAVATVEDEEAVGGGTRKPIGVDTAFNTAMPSGVISSETATSKSRCRITGPTGELNIKCLKETTGGDADIDDVEDGNG